MKIKDWLHKQTFPNQTDTTTNGLLLLTVVFIFIMVIFVLIVAELTI